MLEAESVNSKEVIRAEYETVEVLKLGTQPMLLQYDSVNRSLPLITGREYLIYASPPYLNDSVLHVTVCSSSREYNKVHDAMFAEKYRVMKVDN